MRLATQAAARAIDVKTQAEWGLAQAALVEAAGRISARTLICRLPTLFSGPGCATIALLGTGNNAADVLVALRALVLDGRLAVSAVTLAVKRRLVTTDPAAPAARFFERLGATFLYWNEDPEAVRAGLAAADLALDGLAGTGLSGPLTGAAAEMVAAVNTASVDTASKRKRPFVVACDLPSGLADSWRPGQPLLRADATLAIEPRKACLYLPLARAAVGRILPVAGIFPPSLLAAADGPDLIEPADLSGLLPPVPLDAYKQQRGTVEIFAGSLGLSGAALLAAAGAQAAGAGMVALTVDAELYPLIAQAMRACIIRPLPPGPPPQPTADALLAGPGWGRATDRSSLMAVLAAAEASGAVLVLDADALPYAKARRFSGRTIMTPHPGEFAAMLDQPKEALLADPDDALRRAAERWNAVVILKGAAMRIAAPDGRVAIIDGMAPVLAAGGSGDVLAGLCVGLAGRAARSAGSALSTETVFNAACAGAVLLMAAGRNVAHDSGFADAAALATAAGRIAAACWLPGGPDYAE